METPLGRTKKFYTNGPGHMIKMTPMPIYSLKMVSGIKRSNDPGFGAFRMCVLQSLFK